MKEKLDKRDILQISIGSLVGAMSFSVEGGIIEISDRISLLHILVIVLISITFSYLISYTLGVRKLGDRKMLLLWGYIPARIMAHYFSALLFSAFILWVFGANLGVPTGEFLKRIVVLALPATVTSSAADLIDSQKWRK